MSTRQFTGSVHPLVFALSLLVFAFASLGFSSDAHARSKRIDVRFDRIEVTQHPGRLIVDYTIDGRDWNELQRARINPRLELYLPQGRSHKSRLHASQALESRRGTIVFRGTQVNPHQRDVTLQLSGKRGKTRIHRVAYGRQRGDALNVAVARPTPRHTTTVVERPAPRRTTTRTTTVVERRVVERPAPAPARRGVEGSITIRL